jgi:predicted dehydrogenase
MGKLAGVLIGCGAIAREHLRALETLENVEVAAVCDLSPARAEATAERFSISKWYSNYPEMLANTRPDLVHITTPPSSHFDIAKDCLAAGLNVLCEKPITADYQQFSILKHLALENQCALMENHNLRFHSSIQRIVNLLRTGELGDVVDVQVCYSLNVTDLKRPYADPNAAHYSSVLRGGVIGDFLTHVAYLTYIFCGPVLEVRTLWRKHEADSVLSADEFRAIIKGERAPAHIAFSGNAQPEGVWVRVSGTRMHAEANLFAPPRLTLRRLRKGEPALMSLFDGIVEARDVLTGTLAGFVRKLAGKSRYDGLSELIAATYRALELHNPQPIALDEIDNVARLVDSFTKTEFKL